MSPLTRQYLVTFCNQLASVRHSACILDLETNGIAWVNVDSCDVTRDFAGFCGACVIGDQMVVCTQSSAEAMLAVVATGAHEVQSTYRLEGVRDPHSIVYHDGYVYVCSTGTNEIYRVKFDGKKFHQPEVFWRYPKLSYEEDQVHLNGLTILDNRFVVSCFGPKKADGSWGRRGRVFFLDSGQKISGNLDQPHSPLAAGNRLFFAESGTGKIHVCDQTDTGSWIATKEIPTDGYTRGLALRDGTLLVGISSLRSISRSKKKPITRKGDVTKAAIISVDLVTWKTSPAFDISPFAREIYDIIPLNSAQPVDPVFPALCARVEDMEQTTDRHNVEMQAVNASVIDLQGQLIQRRKELNSQKAHAKTLQADLTERLTELEAEKAHAKTLQADLTERLTELNSQKTHAKTLQADLAERLTELEAEKTLTEGLRADLAKRQSELQAQRTRAGTLQAELEGIRASLLWRVGNPLQFRWRKLRNLVLRIRERDHIL